MRNSAPLLVLGLLLVAAALAIFALSRGSDYDRSPTRSLSARSWMPLCSREPILRSFSTSTTRTFRTWTAHVCISGRSWMRSSRWNDGMSAALLEDGSAFLFAIEKQDVRFASTYRLNGHDQGSAIGRELKLLDITHLAINLVG